MPSIVLVLIAFSAVLDGVVVNFKPGDQYTTAQYKTFDLVWAQYGASGTGYLLSYASPVGSNTTAAVTSVMEKRARGVDEKDLSLELQTAVILDLL